MKTISLILLLSLLIQVVPAFAKSGVESIIEKDMADNGGYDADNPDSWIPDYSYDPAATNSWYSVDLSFENMKSAVEASLGVPESNYLILILFSLAALLQMARVITGTGDWVSFSIRVIVILGFLRCYSMLFDGVEIFFGYLTDNILSGQTAYDSFWAKQQVVMEGVMTSIDGGLQSVLTTDFLKQGLFFALTCITSIFAFALYTLIFLVQCCITITLRYLGPILISLAVIPETDFTSGFISTTFQTFSWSVIAAILIKIMGTTTFLGNGMQLNIQDFVSISAMNICFALAFLTIPIMTGMLFAGKGLGGLGAAVTSLGGGMMQGVAGWVGRNTAGRAWNGAKAVGTTAVAGGAGLALQGVKATGRFMMRPIAKPLKDLKSSASNKIRSQATYAFDHLQRLTTTGRARYNHKYHGNYGLGQRGSAKANKESS